MLSDDDWEPLRTAVPSFAERWRAFVGQPWYEDDPSYAVAELARHLVAEAAAGRTRELLLARPTRLRHEEQHQSAGCGGAH